MTLAQNKPSDAAHNGTHHNAQDGDFSASLTRLLRPSSIAVIGGKWAEAVVLSCVEVGFKGDIWPVHPQKDSVAGYKAYPDLAALPAPPDAVFLGVNRKTSIAMVEELSAMGAGGVVAFASGFAEVADGKAYQDALIASAGDMAILGPNCYGMINYLDGALLWPDVHGGEAIDSGVALITQSSNLAINLTMQLGGLPVAYTLTLGNQAMIGMADLIKVVAADERVTAIGLHIEGINDAAAFAEAVHAAKAMGKSILALKAGLSDAAQNMTISHTASLAGGNAASEAFFDAIGVGVVHSIEELLGGLSLLHCFGRIDDPSLMTMSCSGGEASLIADAAMRGDILMPELSDDIASQIKATVNPLVTVSNPFDYHTFDWGDSERLTRTFSACMLAGIGLTALIIDFPKPVLGRSEAWQTAIEALLTASQTTGAKAVVLASMPEGIPHDKARWLMERGIPAMRGFDHSIAAIKSAFHASQDRALLIPAGLSQSDAEPDTYPDTFDEVTSKAMLAKHHVSIPKGDIVKSQDAAIEIAGNRRVVMKAVSSALSHKTELGAVRLNIQGKDMVAEAYNELRQISGDILIEDMIDDGIAELIVGARHDPVVGLYLMLGTGGVMAELLRDTATVMIGLPRHQIKDIVLSLKAGQMLNGWRGQAKGDIEAAIDAIMAIQEVALSHASQIEELEVNPLLVRAEGKGAVALDALIRMRS